MASQIDDWKQAKNFEFIRFTQNPVIRVPYEFL